MARFFSASSFWASKTSFLVFLVLSSWWTSTMCGLHSWELAMALSASLASSETTSLGWFKHLNDSGSYLIHIIFVLFLSTFNCLNGSLWCDQVNKPALSGVMFCKGMFGRRSGEEKVLSMSGKGPGFPQRKLTEQKHVGALGNRLAGQWWRRHLIIQKVWLREAFISCKFLTKLLN